MNVFEIEICAVKFEVVSELDEAHLEHLLM